MVQEASCTGYVLESGNKVLWILRLTLGYDNIYILNWCECSSGVFRMSSTITHLCVKRHLKARTLCFPEGVMGTGNLSADCFCSATQKAQESVTTSYNCVPILSQPFITKFPLCSGLCFYHSIEPCETPFGKLTMNGYVFSLLHLLNTNKLLCETVSIILCVCVLQWTLKINKKFFCSRMQATYILVWLSKAFFAGCGCNI